MPVTKSAAKALRRDRRRNLSNRTLRSRLKDALDATKKTPTPKTVSQGYRVIDLSAKKHLMHPNKAARLKSQLAKLLVKPAVKPKPKTKAKAKKKTIAKK